MSSGQEAEGAKKAIDEFSKDREAYRLAAHRRASLTGETRGFVSQGSSVFR
ncbi:MAG: hypothetical protein M3Z96_06570 [Pseudomonadota bacterium]|nr:hypothetical protein [Pseudomonadota bacterium]